MSWLVYCKPPKGKPQQIDIYPKTVYPYTVWCPACKKHAKVTRVRHTNAQRLPNHFLISRNQRGAEKRLRDMGYKEHNGEGSGKT